jgi:adenylate cyclase
VLKLKKYILLFTFCLVTLLTKSINKDSLLLLFNNIKLSDSIRYNACNKLRLYYDDVNPDSALITAKLLYTYSQTLSNQKYKASACFALGYSLFGVGKFREAVSYYQESKKKYNLLKKNNKIADCYSNMGLAYMRLGENDSSYAQYVKARDLYFSIKDTFQLGQVINQQALIRDYQGRWLESLDLYYQSLKQFEDLKNKYGQSIILLNIATIYDQMKDTKKSAEILNQSLQLKKEVGDEFGEAIILSMLADNYSEKRQFDSALSYLNKALSMFEATNEKIKISNAYSGLGKIYTQKGDYEKASSFFTKAIALQRKLELKSELTMSLKGMGELCIAQQKYKEALVLCNEGLSIASHTGNLSAKKLNCKCLSTAYEKLNESSKSLKYYKLFVQVSDSLINDESNREATRKELNFSFTKKQLVAKADFEKKQAEEKLKTEAEKKQKNIITIASIIGLILFITIILIIYMFLKKSKKDNKIISKEKQLSEDLLLNILPAEIAEELKAKGDAEAKLHANVSILFTDFKGFTQLSEMLSPRQLISELNYCFVAFDNIMLKYGLEKIKTIGDSYMAASGLPIAHELHAQNMVNAALDICDFMETYKRQRISENRKYFELRIGIHSGEVVAGIVGIKKFAYDVWGDTVNTASRMESSGQVGKVNISEITYQLVKDNFNCEYRGSLEAKGKGKMNMYFIENKS